MKSEPRSDTHHDGAPAGDDRIDEMVEESFPASDPPTGWAGEDPRDRTETQESDSSSSPSDRMSSRLAE
jgi:hypothetical protein